MKAEEGTRNEIAIESRKMEKCLNVNSNPKLKT